MFCCCFWYFLKIFFYFQYMPSFIGIQIYDSLNLWPTPPRLTYWEGWWRGQYTIKLVIVRLMLSVSNLNKKNQVTARSIVCVTCSQYSIFFVLTIDYRTLNLFESDRKQVLLLRLIHCNMTFVGLVIKTIYCNTSSVSPFRLWLGSHLYDSRLGDRLEFYIGQLLPLF